MQADVDNFKQFVGELPEGTTATTIVEYIKQYADDADTHIDPTADNKYNDADAMINLYLNDGTAVDVDASELVERFRADEADIDQLQADMATANQNIAANAEAIAALEVALQWGTF